MLEPSYIEQASSYEEYKGYLKQLVFEQKSSREDHPESYKFYTKLGLQRFKRVEKTAKINGESEQYFKAIDQPIKWLTITETWCGDANQSIPVIEKLASLNQNIETFYIGRDDNKELISRFHTNGSHSIPKLIMLDSDLNVLNTWGPRPLGLQGLIDEEKNKPNYDWQALLEKTQIWYNKDKSQSTIKELVQATKDALAQIQITK